MNRFWLWFLAASFQPLTLMGGDFYENPVKAIGLPDPSVIRTADGYWATATSSDWAPHFPLLFSRDLVNWELRGHVLNETPTWAKGSFWAPEISEYRGTYFVYYTARRHDGRLAVAVATASKPDGPYTDHGVLVAQELGSIDAMAYTDDDGGRWLVWKEDGNSQKRPTYLFLQRLSDDGRKLVGESRRILSNDSAWEGNVVEGPFILKRGSFFYLFYSGANCCGRGCNYALGVARAKRLEGPWEKCPSNPLLAENDAWRCPGHGSITQDADGRYWLLYHAYERSGFVATGRQLLLDEVTFNPDGWPSINRGDGPSRRALAPNPVTTQERARLSFDPFDAAPTLRADWQWPIGHKPVYRLSAGWLTISADSTPAMIAQQVRNRTFMAETTVEIPSRGRAGLAVAGTHANSIAVLVQPGKASVIVRQNSKETEMGAISLPDDKTVRLRIVSVDGQRFRFACASTDDGWKEVALRQGASALPLWDRQIRVGLQVLDAGATTARFDSFTLRDNRTDLLAVEGTQ